MTGLLDFLQEAGAITDELGVPFEEALAIQRQRADERMRERAESNVVHVNFRDRE
jgi:hypothetical protein